MPSETAALETKKGNAAVAMPLNRRSSTPDVIVGASSKRPWTYHNDGRRDWIEDATGDVILNNIGHLDGPLIVACVNEAHACGTDEEAVQNDRGRLDANQEE
jgi:hypothetical protein